MSTSARLDQGEREQAFAFPLNQLHTSRLSMATHSPKAKLVSASLSCTELSMYRIAACAILPWLLCACSKLPEQMEITQQRTLGPKHRTKIPKLSKRARLGLPEAGKGKVARSFAWDTPPGWESLQPAQFRDINLRVKGEPKAQCYLTRLSGGSLAENVNRWRGQMGLAPIGAAELAKLETIRFFGKKAPLVVLDGKYTGMGRDSAGSSEWRMYATLLKAPMFTVSVKMTGPQQLLKKERQNFERFVASIRLQSMGQAKSDGPKAIPEQQAASTAASPASSEKTPASIRWDAPKHWQSGPPRSMRLATFYPGGDKDAELSLITLTGTGGGLIPNLQRWYDQMEITPPSEAELRALPKIDVLGVKATLIELSGSYRGMGSEGSPGSMMLGAIAQPTKQFSVYIKMTGPEAKLRAEKEHFLAFCKSLRFE
ncbi:MAG: hypothetical protein CSA62_15040 [Planctomycetota bacterium]|nr:MAG: hypothetical protein CSA62_15040 [Planctomycetota bacterium]